MERHIFRYDSTEPTKNWQQIFRAGGVTWIFHNACQRKDQIKCDAIIPKNNLKKRKKFHHQHMNAECHCKYFFLSFTECLFFGPNYTCKMSYVLQMCSVLLGLNHPWMLWPLSRYLKQSVESVSRVSQRCRTVQSFQLAVSWNTVLSSA